MKLHTLVNTSRPGKKCKRLGRGTGSNHGKTCGRGTKGAGSRSGWQQRAGAEGGQMALYRRTPERGFSNARFRKEWRIVNLETIERLFKDGEVVNPVTLHERGCRIGQMHGIKILGNGQLTKKVTIEAHAVSAEAAKKLEEAGLSFTLIQS